MKHRKKILAALLTLALAAGGAGSEPADPAPRRHPASGGAAALPCVGGLSPVRSGGGPLPVCRPGRDRLRDLCTTVPAASSVARTASGGR